MAFNREEWLAEMEQLKDVPVLDGEEVQASELIDEELKNNQLKNNDTIFNLKLNIRNNFNYADN